MKSKPITLQTIKDRCVEEGDCWIWNQGQDGHGYPSISVNRKTTNVRRLVYKLTGKHLGQFQPIRATCGNKLCCNPDHLVTTTRKQLSEIALQNGSFHNPKTIAKRAETIRAKFGKLDMEKARQIRLSNDPTEVEAERYGVSKALIIKVRAYKAWKEHINPFAGLAR